MLSRYDRAVLDFGLERLETRRLLAITASVDGSHNLNINGSDSAETIVVNKLSNGKISVTGVATHFTPGSGSGQFNKIKINAKGGSDTVTINNNLAATPATILGGGGNDTLTGGKGNESIFGDSGNDNINGQAGNDTVDGGTGADVLDGGADIDTANYSYRTDNLTITLNGQADDGGNGGAEHDNVKTEEVIAGSGNDTITGSPNDDFLAGGAGKDVIDGMGGNDDINGSTGQDVLLGNTGNDFIQAKNQDVDQVSGGKNTDGTPELDLASVDPIDVPAVQAAQAQLANLIHAAVTPVTPGPSDLDTTYGVGGIASGPDLNLAEINAVAVDSQGRVIFVGSGFRSHGDSSSEDMVVLRYTADGEFDTTFGVEGERAINFADEVGGDPEDHAYGVAIGANDSIIVVGSTGQPITTAVIHPLIAESTQIFAIARLTEAGALDTDFSDNGKTTLDLTTNGDDPFNSIARDVAIQEDGNIVVVGDNYRQNQIANYDPASEFSPDSNPNGPWSYGYSPQLTDPVTLYDTATTVGDGRDFWTSSQLQSSQTLAPDVQHNGTGDNAGGLADGQLALEPGFYGQYSHVIFTAPVSGSYDINGEFDSASEGGATTDVHVLVNGVSQFDGTIDEPSDEAFAPFDLSGVFLNAGDTVEFSAGYGDNQSFTEDTTALSAEVTRTSAPDDQTFAAARFTDSGGLDTTFNFGQGFNTMDVGSGEQVSSVALQDFPEDFGAQRIVVGGTADQNFTLARFLGDGERDFSFGDNFGYTQTTFDEPSQLNDIAVDADNNIFAAGLEHPAFEAGIVHPDEPSLPHNDAILARYDAGGSQTHSIFQEVGGFNSFNAVSIDGNGKVLAAGFADSDYLVGRYHASDLTFDTDLADGPITTDLAPDSETTYHDNALAIAALDTGQIVAAGASFVDGEGPLIPSAARYLGDSINNPLDVEEFITDGNLKDPPPELQEHLDDLSKSALAYVLSDPDDQGNAELDLGDDNDLVILHGIVAADGEHVLAVTYNGITKFYDQKTTNVLTIHTGKGNDTVLGDNSVLVETIIDAGEGNDYVQAGGEENVVFGGPGKDQLFGGREADVLVGGPGEDTATGNEGNDILIGGTGVDHLYGSNGEDIMIGGTTSYDTDATALRALMFEWWHTASSNAVRIDHIQNGGGINGIYVLSVGANRTVFDDGAADLLDGGYNRDWFFKRVTGVKDTTAQGGSTEQISLV